MDCKNCGSKEFYEELMEEENKHYSKIICRKCNQFAKWGKKPENESKRSDKNKVWRKKHKQKDGLWTCGFCGITSEIISHPSQWDADHIIPLSEGGDDEFENTMMLCIFCHSMKNSLQTKNKALMKGVKANGER